MTGPAIPQPMISTTGAVDILEDYYSEKRAESVRYRGFEITVVTAYKGPLCFDLAVSLNYPPIRQFTILQLMSQSLP